MASNSKTEVRFPRILGNDRRETESASARPSSIKGRPSQTRSVRMPQGSSYSRVRSSSYSQTNRVAHDAYRRAGASRGYNEPIRSVSVSQVRDSSRRVQKKSPSRAKGIVIMLLVLAVILGVAGIVVYNLNLFPVKKVTVSGVEHLTAEEMTDLAAVPQDTTLIRVGAAGIESRLESNPWVKDATAERIFPDTINLKINERKITAIVEVLIDDSKTTQTWALASDGDARLMRIPDRSSDEGKKLASKIYRRRRLARLKICSGSVWFYA